MLWRWNLKTLVPDWGFYFSNKRNLKISTYFDSFKFYPSKANFQRYFSHSIFLKFISAFRKSQGSFSPSGREMKSLLRTRSLLTSDFGSHLQPSLKLTCRPLTRIRTAQCAGWLKIKWRARCLKKSAGQR